MMSRRTPYVVIGVTILLGLLSNQQTQCQTYNCFGDVNGDGFPLEVADLVRLTKFVNSSGPAPYLPPSPLSPPCQYCEGDLNGDCAIDQGDIELFQNYLIYGRSVFPIYPVPISCTQEDTLRGACCDGSAHCYQRTPTNCGIAGGTYFGNGTPCDLVPPGCDTGCAHAPKGLVAWYPLNETSGTVAKDIAGGHDGVHSSAPLGNVDFVAGKIGGAYAFHWADRGIVRVFDDPFEDIDTDFTIDAWIYAEAPDGNCTDDLSSVCYYRTIIDNMYPSFG